MNMTVYSNIFKSMTKYDESYLDGYEYDKGVLFCRNYAKIRLFISMTNTTKNNTSYFKICIRPTKIQLQKSKICLCLGLSLILIFIFSQSSSTDEVIFWAVCQPLWQNHC